MKLIKNFTLLSMVEAARSHATPTPKGHPVLHKSKTSLLTGGGGAFSRDMIDELEECKSEDDEECIE